MNPDEALAWWHSGQHRPMNKWLHYFDIYERHFRRYVGTPVRILEIGVSGGGSLQFWRAFFGPQSYVVGLDIEDARFEEEGIHVEIGDQADRLFLRALCDLHGPFDIIVDDGSHRPPDILASFDALYLQSGMKDDGVYLVEDMHTNFRKSFAGDLGGGEWIHFVLGLMMQLMAVYGDIPDPLPPKHPSEMTPFVRQTSSISFYPQCIVFERARRTQPLSWDYR